MVLHHLQAVLLQPMTQVPHLQAVLPVLLDLPVHLVVVLVVVLLEEVLQVVDLPVLLVVVLGISFLKISPKTYRKNIMILIFCE